jgi:pyridoxal 5'-phosphate synthase pdxT subunit
VKVGILALQGDVREHAEALTELGADVVRVRVPDDLAGVDAMVLPGGESTTMSLLLQSSGLFEPLAARLDDGMPAFGTCAGMILLATEVLDGRPDQRGFDGIEMTVRRNAFGRQVDSFEAEVEIEEIAGGPFHAVFIRAPWVERVGPDVHVLGRVKSPAAAIMPGQRPSAPSASSGAAAAGRIVAVRQQHLLATAFHPELTGDLRLHRYFVEMATGAGQTTED